MPALCGGGNGHERNQNKILVATRITETKLTSLHTARQPRKNSCPAPGDCAMLGHGPSLTAGNPRRPACAPGSCQTGPAGPIPRPGSDGSLCRGNPATSLTATL